MQQEKEGKGMERGRREEGDRPGENDRRKTALICLSQVVALRSIAAGDEVTISYIDDTQRKSRADRQKELKGCYLFDCTCTLCENQKNQ